MTITAVDIAADEYISTTIVENTAKPSVSCWRTIPALWGFT
jgi:hypothetical protein